MSLNFSFIDFLYYFKKNRKVYFSFLLSCILGVIVAIFIALSSDSYLSLLTSSDKLFYAFINGTVSYGYQVSRLIFKNLILGVMIFLVCLNFYTGLLSFLVIGYQSALMFLSFVAIISQYGLGGILLVIFLALPTNLIFLLNNILFSGVCIKRSYEGMRVKKFYFGLKEKSFLMNIAIFIIVTILLSCLILLIIEVVLRSRVFIIF